MCGIIGYVGEQEAAPILIDGLGAWSTAATTASASPSSRRTAASPSTSARASSPTSPPRSSGQLAATARQGIGHTRWATHGKPTDVNAHPHTDCTGDVVVIHNGIVENHRDLKQQLMAPGTGSTPRPTPRSSRT